MLLYSQTRAVDSGLALARLQSFLPILVCCHHVLAGPCKLLLERLAICHCPAMPGAAPLLQVSVSPSHLCLCRLPVMPSGSGLFWCLAERDAWRCFRHCCSLSRISHGKWSASNVSCSSYSPWLPCSGMLLSLTVILKTT